MSKISEDVFNSIRRIFPLSKVKREHYVKYRGVRLFFDFFILDLKVLVEVQGSQHTQFTSHFHLDKENFSSQRKRDNLKIEYIENSPELSLVRFNYDEKITDKLVINKIHKAIKRGFYE
jgi:very-short-patch-repair endonuclease